MTGQAGTGPWVDDLPALVHDVRSGSRVSVSGFHFTRAPIAQLLALADAGVRDLHYIAWGGGLPLELLLDRNMVGTATLCFSSLDVLGPAPRFRRAVESERLELHEWTALGMINGLRAAGENLAFEVLQEPAGSSLAEGFSRPAPDPFGAGAESVPMSAVRPLPVDVFLLHAQRADEDGNVEIQGARGLDMSTVFAARQVLVTVEERVARGQLGAPRSFIVPRTFVTKLAVAPSGAYPSSCLPYYPTDFRALRRIVDAGHDREFPVDALRPGAERLAMLSRRAALPAAGISAALQRQARQQPDPYTLDELLVCVLSRTIGESGICSVGAASPLPTAAYLLAKHLRAPGLMLMSHNGGLVDPPVRPLALAANEYLDFVLSAAHTGGDETYHWYYQRGLITHEVVGSAQVDRTGATNNLWVEASDGRRVRLPGQGGMADVANLHANFMIYLPRQSRRNTVAEVKTVSARRVWHDAQLRRRYGLRPGRTVLLTNLGLFEYDSHVDGLVLRSIHPGVDLEQVRHSTGFEVVTADDLTTTAPPTADDLTTTAPPTAEELSALRRVVDPLGIRRLDLVGAAERQALIDDLLNIEEGILDNLSTERP
jgi:glutaconate CoA-transferase subunit A